MIEFCIDPVGLAKYFLDPNSSSALCRFALDAQPVMPALSALTYIKIFALTCGLEAPIYLVGGKHLSVSARLIQILILNLATHPLVTWVFPVLFFHSRYGTYILASELFAPVVELLLLRFAYAYSWRRSALVAISANLFSWWVGPYAWKLLTIA